MKYPDMLFSAISLLMLTCLVPMTPAQDYPQMLFRFADTPFSPFVRGEMGGVPEGGIAVRLVRRVFAELEIGTDMKLLPWNRVIKMAEYGRIDGILNVLATPERETFLVFSSPYYQSTSVIYFDSRRLPDFSWEKPEDLLRYRIGLVRGYAFSDELIRRSESDIDPLIDWSDTSEMNFAKLLAGRVELVIEDEAVGHRILSADPKLAAAVGTAGKPFILHRYRMAIAKASSFRHLLSRIDDILDRLRRSGELDAIIGEELALPVAANGGL